MCLLVATIKKKAFEATWFSDAPSKLFGNKRQNIHFAVLHTPLLGLSGCPLTVGQLPPSEMSHTERSVLDCEYEELEKTLRATAAGGNSVAPLLSKTAPQHVPSGTRAARVLQFGLSCQTAAQDPISDSFGCYLLTWSEPGQDIPSDWDHGALREQHVATLLRDYELS
uniref:Uncharacterized protein n=1 Tax=Sphaerodactylus townsendi TaxID=933632 RepID=A0ACB8G3Q8_9SAUR